jgi:hypothetical protein
MPIDISVSHVTSRKLAAVRRQVPLGAVPSFWRPALHQVWAFLRTQPGLRTDGHNIFLYERPASPGAPMNVDFGVEVVRSFTPSGEVYETETPAGEAAIALHRGPYDQLRGSHDAVQQWIRSNARTLAGQSWEIYGDWSDDTQKLETRIVYLLS